MKIEIVGSYLLGAEVFTKFENLTPIEIPPVLLPDAMNFPTNPSEYALFFLAAGCSVSFIILYKLQPRIWSRFAFQIAVLINLIFQWPAAFAANSISNTISSPFWYQASLGISVVCLSLFLYFTRSRSDRTGGSNTLWLHNGTLLIPLTILFFLLVIYFVSVPPTCTGLFAFIFDPHMTALAREVSVNLVPSGIATTSLTVALNVFVPINCALGVGYSIINFKEKKYFKTIFWCFFSFVIFSFALIPGIKGLILPSAVVLSICIFSWVPKIKLKKILAVTVLLVAGLAIIGFDTLAERNLQFEPFQFTQCARSIGSADQAKFMLVSIAETGGYGLSATEIRTLLEGKMNSTLVEPEVELSNSQPQESKVDGKDSPTPEFSRYLAYAQGAFTRTFIVPSNVAVLHFKYVEDFGSPGVGAMPFASKFTGSSIDVPNRVFREYISTASSDSNKEISGTAPTSSVIAWNAYYGPVGLAFSIGAIIGIDLFISYARRRAAPALQPLIIGLGISGAFLFTSSDFFNAMTSHGFFVALLMMWFWSKYSAVDLFGRIRGFGPLLITSKNL